MKQKPTAEKCDLLVGVLKKEGELTERVKPKTIKFIIPFTLPSLNVYMRLHWAKRERLQQEIDDRVYLEIRSNFGEAVPDWGRIKIEYLVHSNDMTDYDNRAAILKIVNDSIKKTGIVKDDNPKYMEYGLPEFVVNRQERKIEIVITRIDV